MRDLDDIIRRKQTLIARCEAQRLAIASAVRDLERPIAMADRVLAVAKFLRSHPILVGAAVAAFMFGRRRTSIIGLLARGVGAWRLWRSISIWARRLGIDLTQSRPRNSTGHVAS
jgi:YqjK-like protein